MLGGAQLRSGRDTYEPRKPTPRLEPVKKAAPQKRAAPQTQKSKRTKQTDFAAITREEWLEGTVEETEEKFAQLLHKLYYDDGIMRGRDVLFYKIKKDYPNAYSAGLSRRFIAGWLTKQEVHSVFTMGPQMAKQRTIQRIQSKQPMNRCVMDLIDMATKESKGKMWILNVIDAFSKYAWSKALPDKEAPTVVKYLGEILDEMKKKFGDKAQPRMIQSDNGSEFIAKEMKKFLEQKNIKQVFSLPGKPSTQGVVERFNGTLERGLNLIRFQEGKTNWPDYLDKVVENYNSNYQDSIRQAPIDVMKKWSEGGDIKSTFEQLEKKRLNWNPNLTPADAKLYKVGDKVRIRLEQEKRAGRNWSRDWFTVSWVGQSKYGPQYSRTMYQLKTSDGQFMPELFQNDQLMKYTEPTTLMAEDVPQFIVQRLVEPTIAPFYVDKTKKKTVNKQAYIVKFVGQKEHEATERDILIEDVPKLVRKFEKEHNVQWNGLKQPTWKRA
jgi:hypothetical protein